MPRVVTRIAGALLALVGVALGALGLWFATQLGSSGTASFTARPTSATSIVVGPEILNRVDGAVRVTAHGNVSDPVTIVVAAPSDARAFLAEHAVTEVSGVEVSGWKLLTTSRTGTPAGPVDTADLWRNTSSGAGSASVRIVQSDAPETVVISAPKGVERLVLTWTDSSWFVTAVITSLVGLALLFGGVLLLVRGRRARTVEVTS